MKQFSISLALAALFWLAGPVATAAAAPCLIVTLTGTQGGPSVLNGLAGSGTLVRYGDDSNNCSALTESDYRKSAQEGGCAGSIVVGTDLASIRLPAK